MSLKNIFKVKNKSIENLLYIKKYFEETMINFVVRMLENQRKIYLNLKWWQRVQLEF